MACYHPIPAYQSGPGAPPKLWASKGTATHLLPCGGCVGCLSTRALQWGHRSTHEAALWPSNTFLTLTYDDENLPAGGYLAPRDLCLFIKRLRERAARNTPDVDKALLRDRTASIRYLACGEYGDANGRPHYHLALFNLGFTETQKVGKESYEAEILHELWPQGKHQLSEFTTARAAYIAKYNLKGRDDHDADGVWRPRPFLRMSTRPAIGHSWLMQYKTDLTHGYLVDHQGNQQGIPRSYLQKLKDTDPSLYEEINIRKLDHARAPYEPKRMEAAEIIQKQRMVMRNL